MDEESCNAITNRDLQLYTTLIEGLWRCYSVASWGHNACNRLKSRPRSTWLAVGSLTGDVQRGTEVH